MSGAKGAIAPRLPCLEHKDGFYWVEWEGDTLVAGLDQECTDDDVVVLSGPISPPKVPR